MKLNFLLTFLLTSLLFSSTYGSPNVSTVFKSKKPIIGVVNLRALPGRPEFVSMDKSIADAMAQVKILEDAGFDGVLFENPHGEILSIDPATITAMTVIVKEAVQRFKKIQVGLEVLWHNPLHSIAMAKATGAKFIRTDFFSDDMTADGKTVTQDPKELIKYRKTLASEANFAIFTDIQVKYAEMIDKTVTVEQSAARARENLSDGLIVTSTQSGKAPEKEKLDNAKKGAKDLEVIIGSGFSTENARELLPHADAVIVGTSIMTKTGGDIIKDKAVALMKLVKELRKN